MNMVEASRLYQAVLEDRRARLTEIGDGYRSTEENTELDHLDTEVARAHADIMDLWAGA